MFGAEKAVFFAQSTEKIDNYLPLMLVILKEYNLLMFNFREKILTFSANLFIFLKGRIEIKVKKIVKIFIGRGYLFCGMMLQPRTVNRVCRVIHYSCG
ncbi:hypothetical protein CKY02_14280 [Photorhabdus bodei]|uniref:Uncharacterized protein n=1 Tax=Photorhabdus bodei TaxID=2029681 RepID=A0A329X589_9GAMM|nr:hypothetical protein CKY02_14280 [Photorhabdus bodei]